jgi:uncharacterized membrane protein YeiH
METSNFLLAIDILGIVAFAASGAFSAIDIWLLRSFALESNMM